MARIEFAPKNQLAVLRKQLGLVNGIIQCSQQGQANTPAWICRWGCTEFSIRFEIIRAWRIIAGDTKVLTLRVLRISGRAISRPAFWKLHN